MSSQTIDNKVVRMEFDNKKFEKNVAQSLNTLDKLKKAVDFDKQNKSLKELQNTAKHFSIDEIGESLERVEHKFSGFGVAGMTVMSELTKAAMNTGKKMLSALTAPFAQMKSGGWNRAMNIKDAEFSMKGLGILGEKLEKIKDDINYAVSGTAYGYDAAAKAAAQFAASNVKIGEDMKTALRSVSGVAAQTNSSYEDIAAIFTTVAANGKLMTQQLRQLSFRGLNASATLAKYFGVSEAAIADMVKKSEISFNDFAMAMDSAFGEHAKAANETFQGALNNMKAALSRIGANFADPIIDAERDVFNRLRDLINSLNFAPSELKTEFTTEFQEWVIEEAGAAKRLSEDVLPVIEEVRDHFTTFLEDPELFSALNIFVEGLRNVFAFLTQVGQVAVTAYRQVFTDSEATKLREMAERFWEFTDSLYMSEGAAADLQAVFRGLFSVLNIFRKGVRAVTAVITTVAGPVARVSLKILGLIGDAIAEVDYYLNIIEATIDYVIDYFRDLNSWGERTNDTFSLMDTIFDGLRFVLAKLSNVIRTGLVFTIGLIATAGMSLVTAMLAAYEAIGPVIDSLGRLGDAIGGQIIGVLDALGMSFDTAGIKVEDFLKPLEYLFEIIKTAGVIAVSMLVYAIDSLSAAIENYNGLKEGIRSFTTEGFTNTKEALVEVGSELQSVAGSTEETQNALVYLGEKIKMVFSVVKDILGDVIEKIGDFVSEITPARIAALALTGVIMGIAVIIGRILFAVSDLAFSFSELTRTFSQFTKAMTMRLNPLANTRSVMQQIAMSILMIAAAMLIIALIDVKALYRAGNAILAISGIIILFIGITSLLAYNMHRLNYEKEFNKIMYAMLGIAGVFIAMSIAMKAISKMDTTDLDKKIGATSLIMAELAGIFALMTILAKPGQGGVTTAIISAGLLIAFAVGLNGVIKAFNRIKDFDFLNAIKNLAAITLTLAALFFISKNAVKPQDVAGLLLMCASLWVVMHSVERLAKIDINGMISRLDGYVGAIMAIVGVCTLLLTFSRRGNEFLKASTGLSTLAVGMSIAVLALAHTVELAGKMKDKDFKKGYSFVLGALAMFALLGVVSRFVEKGRPMEMGVMFMAMGVAINLLISAVYLLGTIKQTTLKKGLLAISVIGAMFAGLMWVSGFTAAVNISSFKVILALATSLVLISGMLVVLSMVNWTDLLHSTLAMVGVITAFCLGLKAATSNLGGLNMYSFAVLAMMGVAMIALAAQLTKLAKYDWKKTLAASASIAIVMLTLVEGIKYISKMAAAFDGAMGFPWKELIATLVIVFEAGLLMTFIGDALLMLVDYPWQSILAAGAAMAGCLIAMAVVAEIAKTLGSGPLIASLLMAIKGIAIITVVTGLLGLVAWGIGKLLNEIDKAGATEEALTRFGNVMYLIGEGYGKLIAGFAGGTLSFIPQVGEYLGTFWEKSKAFWTGMKENLNAEVLESVKIFASTVAVLAAIDFAEGFNKFALLKDVIDKITGNNPAAKFGPMFASLGDAMQEFKDNIGEFSDEDLETVKKALEAANTLVDIARKIPRQDDFGSFPSLATIFGGEKSMSSFGYNIQYFGKALADFSEAVTGDAIDYGACKTALKVGKDLAKFAEEKIGTHGGIISWFTGDNSFGQFSTNVTKFGEALYGFSLKAVSISEDAAKKSEQLVKIGVKLAEMASLIPSSGGLISVFTGNEDYAEFAKNLPLFGDAIAGFVNKTKGIPIGDFASVEKASAAGLALAELATKIPDQHDWTGKGSLKKLGSSMKEFAKALKDGLADFDKAGDISTRITNFENFVNRILGVVDKIEAKQTTAFTRLADDMKRLTAYSGQDNGLTLISEQTYNNVNAALDDSLGAITKKYNDFYTNGQSAIGEWAKGLKSGNAAKDAVNAAWSTANNVLIDNEKGLKSDNLKSKFKEAGKFCIDGFLLGLKDKQKLAAVHEAGAAIGNEADKGIREKEKIKSPSRVFMQNGEYVGEGFIIGIKKYLKKAYEAGSDTGGAAEEGIRESLGIHSPSWVTELLGKFTASGFYKGLMEKINSIKRAGENIGETLFNKVKEIAGPEAMEALGLDSIDGLKDGLGDLGSVGGGSGGSGGSGRSGGSASQYKWTKKDQQETLLYLMGIFQTTSKKYDAFNKDLIKKGKITKDYLIKSFKDKGLRAAAEEFAPSLIKTINKSIKSKTKGLKGDELVKKIKSVTKKYVEDVKAEYAQLTGMIQKMAGGDAVKNLLSPNFRKGISKFIKNYDSSFKVVRKNIKNTMKDLGISKDAATKRYEYFGDYLYRKTDQYKQDKKQLKAYNKEYNTLIKHAEKYRNIVNDPKASAKKKLDAKQQLASIYKDMQKLDKDVAKLFNQMSKHRQNALKKFKKEVKESLKEFTSIKNIDFSETFSGFSKFSEQSQLAQEAYGSAMDAISASTTKVSSNVTEAFDVMSASMDTGINLFEKFTKTGTAEVDALLERADGQLKGYEEFQNGLTKLEEMGLSQSVIDDLESQGPQALNYIRGFMNMSEEQIKQYNQKVAKKEQFESKTLQRSLSRQKKQYDDWASDISELLGKIPDKLMEKLKSAGVSGANFVHALTTMDENELKKFGDLYASSLVSNVSESLSSITATGTAVNAINIDYFIKNLEDNSKAVAKWKEDLASIKSKVAPKLYDAIKAMGIENRTLLDSILKATDEQLKKYNDLYVEYTDNMSKDSLKTMAENIMSNVDAARDWQLWLDVMRKEDPRAYKEISSMGFENGYEYGKAWYTAYTNGDEQARKDFSDALASKDRMTFENATREILDKRNVEQQYAKDMDDIADYIANVANNYGVNSKIYKSLKTLYESFLEGGIEGADKVHAIVEEFRRAYSVDGLPEDSMAWNAFIDELIGSSVSAGNVTDSVTQSYEKVIAEGANQAANSSTVLEASVNLGKSVGDNTKKEIKKSTKKAVVDGTEEGTKSAKKNAKAQGTKIGKSVGNGIKSNESIEHVTKSAQKLGSSAVDGIKTYLNKAKGKAAGKNFGNGIASGMDSTLKAIQASCSSIISEAQNCAASVEAAAASAKAALAEARAAAAAASSISSSPLSYSESHYAYESGSSVGSALGSGVAAGITSAVAKIKESSASIIDTVKQKLRDAGKIKSPSRVTMEIGKYLVEGIAVGMEDNMRVLDKPIDDFSKIIKSINEEIDLSDNLEPVIRPTLDLSDVTAKARQLNNILSDSTEDIKVSADNQNESKTNGGGMTFIQNNYSPKALDRLELYRQTRNQFANAKGLVMA